jgi:predicted aspartyl protease
VDKGATFPVLPEDIVDNLNLPKCGEAEAEVATGREKVKLVLAIIRLVRELLEATL